MPRGARAIALAAVLAVSWVLALPTAAHAAQDERPRIGYDVSYPQCGRDLPDDAAFAVVGVNGGLATLPNPCLAEQLEWAADSTGAVRGQPGVQLYVNTANPGELRDRIRSWPVSGRTPYGSCDGGNTLACSWQYGWLRGYYDVEGFFVPAAREAGLDHDPGAYRWWLDVEQMNTWQYGSSAAQARNRAALEGLTARLQEVGAEVGVYSSGTQWRRIVGDVPHSSPLYRLDSWLAGSVSPETAERNCLRRPLVPGGDVLLTQYVEDDLDHNHPCD